MTWAESRGMSAFRDTERARIAAQMSMCAHQRTAMAQGVERILLNQVRLSMYSRLAGRGTGDLLSKRLLGGAILSLPVMACQCEFIRISKVYKQDNFFCKIPLVIRLSEPTSRPKIAADGAGKWFPVTNSLNGGSV